MSASEADDLATKEVPLPEDVTINGGKRTQNASDQLFMMTAGLALLFFSYTGTFAGIERVTISMGAFIVGAAFERLQWMLMADYGSWRGAIRALVGRFTA